MAMWKTMLKTSLFIVPVTITFTDLVASFSKVVGVSMQPLLNPEFNRGQNDWVLQNRLAAKHTHNLHRGDIITFITPYDPKQLAVKRIIGVQGDLVWTKNKKSRTRVPVNHVWVEGDNSKFSHDSNSYGPVSRSLITAKVTHVIWPPSRWQKLDSVEIDTDRLIKHENFPF